MKTESDHFPLMHREYIIYFIGKTAVANLTTIQQVATFLQQFSSSGHMRAQCLGTSELVLPWNNLELRLSPLRRAWILPSTGFVQILENLENTGI